MLKGTIPTTSQGLSSERSETNAWNVPKERMFHVTALVLVPVVFESSVRASDVDDACLQIADLIAQRRLEGVSMWKQRGPAHIARVEDENGTDCIVPQRYRR